MAKPIASRSWYWHLPVGLPLSLLLVGYGILSAALEGLRAFWESDLWRQMAVTVLAVIVWQDDEGS